MNDLQAFIECYEKYYFYSQPDAEKKGVPKNLGTTKREVEDFFFYKDGEPSIVKPLTYENVEYAVAWKAGRLGDDLNSRGKPIIDNYDYKKKGFKIGRSGTILLFEGEKGLKAYYNYLNNNKKDIIEQYKSAINTGTGEIDQKYLTKMYSIASAKRAEKEYVPNGIGSVYIINLLFFLSEGEIPIYDQFAHKALASLYIKQISNGKELIAPYSIFIGSAPDKMSISAVVNMYAEYLSLLKKVFGKCNIERNIDRALWVYGHCSKPYKTK